MVSEQFGVRNGKGTRETLFGFTVLMRKFRDQQKYVYLCFKDYEKVSD